MVSIKHKVLTFFRVMQAWYKKRILCFTRRVSVPVDIVQRLFGGLRSRRTLFWNIKKRYVAIRPTKSDVAIDLKRRAFVKYAVFGGVVFLAGKYFGPLLNTLRGDTVLSEKTFDNFKMIETGKQLQISDEDGNEILTIDKEGF